MSNYRTEIDKSAETFDGVRYVEVETVFKIIDEIEKHVGNLENQIEIIYDKSHDAYLKVKELSSDLF
jgi:uncharacterized protein YoxC